MATTTPTAHAASFDMLRDDYLALVGDTADNIPGAKGIGANSALALVERWGTVEEMIAHVEEIEPTRTRNALANQIDEARLSKRLVTLQCDLPVTLDSANPPMASAR